MTVDLAGPRRRHRRGRPPAFVNRALLAVLRSPLHGLVDGRLCELDYRGRRSGRAVALPVLYAEDDSRLVVLVGDAPNKRWWRNFAVPGPVLVRRGGRIQTGTARLVGPDDPAYQPALQAYVRRHRVAPQPTDRLLLIKTISG